MNWLWFVSYLFGGVFSANAIPHFVTGTMGRPFQSPFAKPPGQGLSSATVNVVWGFFNALVGYLLVADVGAFNPRVTSHILPFGLGAPLRPVSWGQHAGASTRNPVACTFRCPGLAWLRTASISASS